MTREEAVDNLKCLLECNYVDSFEDAENEALDMAIQALEQEPRWIPVSERLPEKDDLYLISFDDGEYDLVSFGKGEFSYSGVVAWMPLPIPYEPQERSDKE